MEMVKKESSRQGKRSRRISSVWLLTLGALKVLYLEVMEKENEFFPFNSYGCRIL
jgi:hypothetical protein